MHVDDLAYREVQRYRQASPWWVLVVGAVVVLPGAGPALEEPGGPSATAVAVLVAVAGGFLALAVAAWRARLVVEVREAGLYVKHFPRKWSFRRVPAGDVASVSTVDVDGTATGVAGINIFPSVPAWKRPRIHGRTYLPEGGGRAVRVERREGPPLVVHSRRPDELWTALVELRAD